MTHHTLPPPRESATDPITSIDDLGQRWRALMGDLGFGEHLLSFVFVGPDRCFIKTLHDVSVPYRPTPRVFDDVFPALRTVLDDLPEGTTVAFLLSGPGGGPISSRDRQWARLLERAGKRFDVPVEPMFRAHDEALVLVEPKARAA